MCNACNQINVSTIRSSLLSDKIVRCAYVLPQVRVRRQRSWLNIPVLSDDETVTRTALWLTREKTELDTPRVKKGPQCRFAFLELDTLNAGDVFVRQRLA